MLAYKELLTAIQNNTYVDPVLILIGQDIDDAQIAELVESIKK